MFVRWVALAHLETVAGAMPGALFDFLSGKALRAPRWVQRLRMEWFFRLLQEPRRLARRYSIDIVRFLFLCSQFQRV